VSGFIADLRWPHPFPLIVVLDPSPIVQPTPDGCDHQPIPARVGDTVVLPDWFDNQEATVMSAVPDPDTSLVNLTAIWSEPTFYGAHGLIMMPQVVELPHTLVRAPDSHRPVGVTQMRDLTADEWLDRIAVQLASMESWSEAGDRVADILTWSGRPHPGNVEPEDLDEYCARLEAATGRPLI
jgi:hypothetical protein